MDCSSLLKELLNLLAIQITITKDFSEQPWSNSFASMDRHNRRTTIGVMKKMVTALDAEHFKPGPLQRRQ